MIDDRRTTGEGEASALVAVRKSMTEESVPHVSSSVTTTAERSRKRIPLRYNGRRFVLGSRRCRCWGRLRRRFLAGASVSPLT
ncbi:hypothetical protein JOF44_002376 [Brachybacterium fresconis]|uniref:Uncharacterized protein n=1 Tax=Brachybacterium fresconis TaxID=173363 RepID=A0ABS4YKZ2_9MICO|nr:hypothetical protein [Brachybacterium fresconis]